MLCISSSTQSSVDIGQLASNERCYVVAKIGKGIVIVYKDYDERIVEKVSNVAGYAPSLVWNLNVGDTLSHNEKSIVTRIA